MTVIFKCTLNIYNLGHVLGQGIPNCPHVRIIWGKRILNSEPKPRDSKSICWGGGLEAGSGQVDFLKIPGDSIEEPNSGSAVFSPHTQK